MKTFISLYGLKTINEAYVRVRAVLRDYTLQLCVGQTVELSEKRHVQVELFIESTTQITKYFVCFRIISPVVRTFI